VDGEPVFPYAAPAARQDQTARAGKKEGGWGEGIFARPHFPPSPNFVFRFAKCAAGKYRIVFARPPVRTQQFLSL